MAGDDMVMIRGSGNTRAVSVLLRGANDYMLDEMDRSLHDAFCVVKRVLESGRVVPGGASAPSAADLDRPCAMRSMSAFLVFFGHAWEFLRLLKTCIPGSSALAGPV